MTVSNEGNLDGAVFKLHCDICRTQKPLHTLMITIFKFQYTTTAILRPYTL